MDGFGEYRSDLPLREAQTHTEDYLRTRQQNSGYPRQVGGILERPIWESPVSRLPAQSSLAVRKEDDHRHH